MRPHLLGLLLSTAIICGFSLCAGCVSAASLRTIYQGVADAQVKIVNGLSLTDEACQTLARTRPELEGCRNGRDLAREGLKDQLKALGTITK